MDKPQADEDLEDATVIGSQLVVGLLLDQTAGRLELDARQVLGAVLLVGGAVLVSWR